MKDSGANASLAIENSEADTAPRLVANTHTTGPHTAGIGICEMILIGKETIAWDPFQTPEMTKSLGNMRGLQERTMEAVGQVLSTRFGSPDQWSEPYNRGRTSYKHKSTVFGDCTV